MNKLLINNKVETTKEREVLIDRLKGLLIILVVVGHVVQENYLNFDQNLIFRFIYSFHMPLFMAVSGYVAYVSYKNQPFINQIRKKFIALVIPFLSWYFLYGYIFRGFYIHEDFLSYANKLILSPDWGLWFLWILFLCFLILYLVKLISRIIKFENTIFEYVMLSFIAVGIYFFNRNLNFSLFGLGLLSLHFPNFVFGYIVAKNKNLFKRKYKRLFKLSFILMPIFLFFWYRTEEPVFSQYLAVAFNSYTSIVVDVYRYLTAFLVSVSVIGILRSITTNRILDLLANIGKRTFEIYSIQFIILGFLKFPQLANENIDMIQLMSISVSSIITIVVCVFIGNVIRLNKITKLLLLGETR